MQPFAADFMQHLTGTVLAMVDTLTGLPQDALDWSPGPEMNSIGVLAAHVAGATRYLIGDVLMNDHTPRNRDAEFATHGTTAEALSQRLLDVLGYCRSVLEPLTVNALEEPRTWRDGSTVTAGWVLIHALDHAAQHVGHMQLTRQLWDLHTRD
jgi:hypothetical protein